MSDEAASRAPLEDTREADNETQVTHNSLEKDATFSNGPDHGSESPSEQASKTGLQKSNSLEELASNDQGSSDSIKSPPLDANDSLNAEESSDHVKGTEKDASPPRDAEWLDILGSGHLKKKVSSS